MQQVVLSHPTGNRNVRAVITALAEAGMLGEFDTTIAVNPKALWLKLLPKKVREELLRRSFPLPLKSICTHPVLELSRLMLKNAGLEYFIKREYGWASVDSVYRSLDAATAKRIPQLFKKKNLSAVYAYEDGAISTFTEAKKRGLKCIYDLPIAFWETGKKLLTEEARRIPEWTETLGGGIMDSAEKLERKTKELELADMIVCPGQFVKDSIPLWARDKKITTAPFGSPDANTEDISEREGSNYKANRPLRVLFVGSMGQRKGLGDLFKAVDLLNRTDIELVVMGSMLAPFAFYKSQLSSFVYEPGRSHEQVLKLMHSCDIFCLPSIVEGRALVMQEAMSQGLPLIITPNTGGEDLIIEGSTGFLVPIRSPEAIAEKLTWFLENRSKIREMGEIAKEHARNYTWEKYGNNIINFLKNSLWETK